MYRIIAYNPDGSQLTIYDPVGAGALPVLAPKSAEEINEAGTVEFALVYGHPAYGLLMPKKTYISAELDGKEFFYGRIINADPSPLTGQIQYQCAGALSFLQDSEVPPDPKKSDGTTDFQTMTAEAFLSRCIDAHNADVGDDGRRIFTVGTVNHSRKSETRQFQISNYQDTRNVIDQNILNYYGGFLRVRRVDGDLYLDWLEDDYGDTDEGVLELGRNIISILHRMNGEDLFTSIRPVGENGITLSESQTMDLYPNAEMAEYGKIVRSVNFPNAKNESDLQTEASAFIEKIQKTLLISSDISLLDMKFADEDQHGVCLGDKFTHIVGFEGTPLIVTARNRDFERPQNDSCTLKNKKAYDGTDSTEPSSTGGSISKRSSRNSSAGGAAFKYIHEYQDRLELNAKAISIAGEQIEIHADQLVETANEFARISHREGAVDTRLNIIEGTGVFQNSEHITSLAGRFHYDPETKAVELLDGSEFKIHQQDGAMITVGTRLTELGQDTSTFKGSALWTQRDNITGVCGEFDIMTIDGKRTLVIKSGGGIKIRRNNTEFGLYDEGNLTGGIMVNKLNDGSVVTKIRGDKIDLATNDGYTQLVADKNGLQTTVAAQQTTIDQHGVTISSMTGSALWTQRDNITGVCGEFDILDVNGVKTLVIKSGGGIKIRRDNTEFGLYDSGTLTAGIIVNKINGGTATIQAKNIELNGTVKLNDVMTVISGAVGISKPLIMSGNVDIASNKVLNLYTATFQGSNPMTLNALTIASMIKTATKSGNTLTLTRFDNSVLTFSSATTLSGAWSGHTYTVTASPQNSAISITISSAVAMQQGECYAYATWTSASSTTPSSISGTSKKLTIVNSTDNTVKLQSAGSDVGLTFMHNKYTAGYNAGTVAGYNSAHVTGKWSGQVFTYSKTTAGSSNSLSITISSAVAMQQGECYAYATWTSSSSTTPSSISGTSKKLTIVNSTDNTVKLQSAGSDVGLTFTHNKYTTGYTAGYSSGYETGWKDGWRAYYDDAYDWYPSTQHPNWTGKAWIPKRNADLFYSRGGHGDGSSTYCEEWSAVETPGGGGSTHSVGVTTYTSGYMKNTTEVNAKSAASTAMGVAKDKLDVRKLVSSPSYWTWCKASCGGSNKYVLIGF